MSSTCIPCKLECSENLEIIEMVGNMDWQHHRREWGYFIVVQGISVNLLSELRWSVLSLFCEADARQYSNIAQLSRPSPHSAVALEQ